MIVTVFIALLAYMLFNYMLSCSQLRLMVRIPKALRQLSHLLGQSCVHTSWRSLNSVNAKGRMLGLCFCVTKQRLSQTYHCYFWAEYLKLRSQIMWSPIQCAINSLIAFLKLYNISQIPVQSQLTIFDFVY